MRYKKLWLCVIGVALAVVVLPALGGELVGDVLFNTGVFPCDGLTRFQTWRPEQTIYLKSLNFEMGLDYNGLADYFVRVVRRPDVTWVARQGWDRYANPTSPFTMQWHFAPDYYRVGLGSSLEIHYACAAFSFPRPNAQIVILGTYTLGAP